MNSVEFNLKKKIEATKEAIDNGTLCKYNPKLMEQKQGIIDESIILNNKDNCGYSERDIIAMVNDAFANQLGVD